MTTKLRRERVRGEFILSHFISMIWANYNNLFNNYTLLILLNHDSGTSRIPPIKNQLRLLLRRNRRTKNTIPTTPQILRIFHLLMIIYTLPITPIQQSLTHLPPRMMTFQLKTLGQPDVTFLSSRIITISSGSSRRN